MKMTKSKYYRIELRPLESFFFGGENTYGEDNEINYFVHSRHLPQQTSLLGMLRYQMLNDDQRSKFSNEEMSDLIGNSFAINSKLNDFGFIDSISPLFIRKENKDYFLSSYENVATDKKSDPLEKLKFETIKHKVLYGADASKNEMPVLENYKPKNGFKEVWISDDDSQFAMYKTEETPDGVFYEKEQVGIQKNQTGETDDKAFFRQSSYIMTQGYSFAFYVVFNQDIELKNDIVTLGGEQSKFAMTVSGFDHNILAKTFPDNQQIQDGDECRLVLLSDAYANNSVYDHCVFAITDTTDFRYIQKFSDKDNFSSVPCKSSKFNLLKRGSVFYTRNISKLKQALNNPAFKQIGYNYFIIKNSFNG